MSTDAAVIEQELVEYAQREAGSRVGRTLAALLRSDRDRLTYWPASVVVDRVAVQKMDNPGNEEAVVIAAAERFSQMRACIGFLVCEDSQPQAGAWLVLNGAIIDPAKDRRTVLGVYGIALNPGEAARWTATQPSAVAERGISRHKLTV